MPSLAEAARRLREPPPAGVDPRAYSILRAVWMTYPRAAKGWADVLPPARFTSERWSAVSQGRSIVDVSLLSLESDRLVGQARRLARLFRAPPFRGMRELDDFRRLQADPDSRPIAWARSFFDADSNDFRSEVLLGCYLLQPFLYAAARNLRPELASVDWQRNRCPFCGGSPYHGYIDSKSGRRSLVCGKCQYPWAFPRLTCPYCESGSREALGFFYLEREPAFRIDSCATCRKVLPTTLICERRPPFPLLDHLETLATRSVLEGSESENQ